MSKISEHTLKVVLDRYNKRSVKDTQIDRVIKQHRAKKETRKYKYSYNRFRFFRRF